MKRPVYAYYKEHTISPRGMIQQICRNRNITEVNYLFTRQSFKYTDKPIQEISDEIKLTDKYGYKNFNIMEQYLQTMKPEKAEKKEKEYKQSNFNYMSLLTHIIYTNNCLNSNKRVHFRILLQNRGFIDVSKNIKTKKNSLSKEEKQALKEEKIENLDFENSNVEKINEYLQIPKPFFKAYAELFIDQNKLTDHLNWRTYAHNYDANDMIDYTGEEDIPEIITTPQAIKNRLLNKDDFLCQMVKSAESKMLYLLEFRKALGLSNVYSTDFYDIEPKKDIDEKDIKQLEKDYIVIFKTRAKEIDFSKRYCVNKHMMIMHKNLFGENIIHSEESGRGKKRTRLYKYTINMDVAQYHRTIIEFSRNVVL